MEDLIKSTHVINSLCAFSKFSRQSLILKLALHGLRLHILRCLRRLERRAQHSVELHRVIQVEPTAL